jgi:alkylation response protein AidB-like acyl-CoA dehydrogenase
MDLLPTPEQEAIVAAAAGFLGKELSIPQTREAMVREEGIDRSVWARCADLGWFGLGLDEGHGGVGYSLCEEALLFREIGRHLAPGPLLASVLGARVAAFGGAPDLAAEILGGQSVVGLAQPVDATVASELSGRFLVLDGADADLLLAIDEQGGALVSTDLVEVSPRPCIDQSVRLGNAVLDGVAAQVAVAATTDNVFLRGVVLSAAMLVGIAEATRDLSVEYAKVREQFGRPIGVNQAIKHPCAEMAVRSEAAYSQLLMAALAVADGNDDARFQASAAKVISTDAAISNATQTVQVHGGMGFTYEHDAHLYVKRARVLDLVLGSRRAHLATLLEQPAQ